MATINMHMKFEIEIPKQSWLMLRKPCRLQTDGQTDRRTDGRTDKANPVYPPSNFIGRGYNKTENTKHEMQQGKSEGFDSCDGLVILLKLDSNRQFFRPCDFEIRWMTPKNNRAPLLCYITLCASFQSHRWIQTEVTVRKRSIRVKIRDLLSRVTLKFDGWPWKTIGHLFYVASSFVHHFIAIGEFKLKLQSGNAQFGSKSAIYCPVWPWNLTDDLEKQ